MAEIKESKNNGEEQQEWEERSLGVLQDFIPQDLSQSTSHEKRRRHPRHNNLHRFEKMKRPMVIPEIILELLEKKHRESALRILGEYLLEKREEDPGNYCTTGYLLYNSCSTMAILLQEVVSFFRIMVDKSVTKRASRRIANVLTLYQCVAANKESRQKFVKSCTPNFLIPLLLFEDSLEFYENVRAIALSVFGIICQAREPMIIQWALDSRLVQLSLEIIQSGNYICKVISLHILEAILQDDLGISHICYLACNHLLEEVLQSWEHLVYLLVADQELSPRLLFHIIRCYFLLCNHPRGFSEVVKKLPDPIVNGSFDYIAEEFPVIGCLLHELLLTVGKTDSCLEISLS